MANPFDQFDNAPARKAGNPFDEFDAKPVRAAADFSNVQGGSDSTERVLGDDARFDDIRYSEDGVPDYRRAFVDNPSSFRKIGLRALVGRAPELLANLVELPANANEAVTRALGMTPAESGTPFSAMRNTLRSGSSAIRELGFEAEMDAVGYGAPSVSGAEVVDAVNPAADVPLGERAARVGRFIPETLLASAPDMVATLNPATLAAYIGSRTNEVAEGRAANDNRENVSLGDLGIAAPAAAVEALLERFTTMRLLPQGTTMATPGVLPAMGRIARELGIQGSLGGVEELAPYLAETVGTETGTSAQGAVESFVGGLLAEGALGGTVQAGKEGAAAMRSDRAAPAAEPAPAPAPQPAPVAPMPELGANPELEALLLQNLAPVDELGGDAMPPAPQPAPVAPESMPPVQPEPVQPEPAATTARPMDAAARRKAIDDGFEENRKAVVERGLRKGDAVTFQQGDKIVAGTIESLGDKDQRVITVKVPNSRGGSNSIVPARYVTKGEATAAKQGEALASQPAARPAAARAPKPPTQVEGKRQWRQTAQRDSRGRPLVEPVLDYSRDTLLEWLGANGGVDFENIRAQGGADPATLKEPSVMRPFGRVGWPAVRRKGGMTLDDLREKMQQDGWLPADDPNAPPQIGNNEALDMVLDAINGRAVLHPTLSGERFTGQAEAMRQEAEAGDADLATDLGFPDAAAMYDAIDQSDESQDSRGFGMADYEEALSLREMHDRLVDAGFGLSDTEIESIMAAAGQDPAAQAAALWRAIEEREASHGTDGPANRRDSQGVESPEGGADGFGRVEEGRDGYRSDQPGLFGNPSPREEVAAEQRRRDDARNGRASDARTDMAAGDGELFAGDRPEQERLDGRVEETGYHGTPHTVDRFSMQKIGSGEGAQAYGWGLYFASRREIAEHYRKGLSHRDFINKARSAYDEFASPDEALADLRDIEGLSASQIELLDALAEDGWLGFDYPHQAIAAAYREPHNFELSERTQAALGAQGNLYRVEIPDAGDMLDWDAPLSEQPEKVRAALESIPGLFPMKNFTGQAWDDPHGKAIYDALGDPQTASEALLAAGIPGLRYLDSESRGTDWRLSPPAHTAAGDWMVKNTRNPDSKGLHFDTEAEARAELERRKKSTHNFVVWDEAAVSTPERVGESRGAGSSRDMFVTTRGDRAASDEAGRNRSTDTGSDRGAPERAAGTVDPPGADGGSRQRADARAEGPYRNPRPDYTPALGRRALNAVDALLRRHRGSVLADTLARDFRETGATELVGQRVESASDLAAAAEVYRNPLFETLRYIFVGADGTVLGETAVSDRMAASATAFPIQLRARPAMIAAWLRTIAPTGTARMWLLHNHPSGDPSPSAADLSLTRSLSDLIGRDEVGFSLAGHVVINHKTFASINRNGTDSEVLSMRAHDAADPLRAPRGMDLSAHRVESPDAAARVATALSAMTDKNSVAAIVTDARGRVALATSIPADVMGTPRGAALLSQLGERSGGFRIFLVASAALADPKRNDLRVKLQAAAKRGLIADVVLVDDDGSTRVLGRTGDLNMLAGRSLGEQSTVRRRRDGSGQVVRANTVSYTTAQSEFMEKAGVAPDTRNTMRKVRDWMGGNKPDIRKDELIQGAINQYYGLFQAVKAKGSIDIENDPYVAARMVNIASTMEAILRFGAPKMERGALRVDRSIPGVFDALKPVHDKLPAFFGWMVARRAQLLKQQGREHLMTDADIAAGLSLRNGNEQAFDQAARDYLRMKNAILDFAEQHGGTIDPAARAAWDHAEYIPFYRQDADAERAIGPGTRKGLSNQSAGIRKLKGGEQALRDPLANIVQNFTRLMDSALKNRAMLLAVDQLGDTYFTKLPPKMTPANVPLDQVKKHLREQGVPQAMIDSLPSGALKGVGRMLTIEAPTGDNVVRVMRDGKAEYHEVADPLLLRSLTAFNDVPVQAWLRPLVWAKNMLTAGATSTPDFLIRNTLRDTGEASVTAREHFIPLWDTMRGAVESLRTDEFTQDLMMAGSYFHGGLFHQGDHEATSRATKRALRRHGMTDSMAEKIVKSLVNPKRWWDVYRSGIEASEMGSRVSLARNRVQAGNSFLEGAFEAKDFLDFQLRGDSAVMQFFIRVIPFLNARLQGNYRLARTATAKDRRKRVLARMAMMAMATASLYAWNMLAYRDEYEELEDWDKDAYWHFAPGTDRHIRIPKPFELGLIAGTSIERGMAALVYQVTGGEVGDRPEQTWKALLRGIFETLSFNPIPQAVKPGAEVYFNYDTFGGRPIESRGDEYKPPSERRGPHTSDTAAAASRAMEAIVGEENTLSPKQMQHLWRGYFGGMGMYLLKSADVATRWLEDAPERPEARLRDFPGVGAIYRGGQSHTTRWVDDLYDLRDQAQTQSNKVKGAMEADEPGRARNIEREWGWLLGERQSSGRAKAGFMHAGVRGINKAADQLSKLRKADLAIYDSRELSPAEKRERLDENARRRNEIARDTVRRFREIERQQTR